MNANPDPLSALRDIHLPEPVSWWPPAIGWWLLALTLLATLWLLWKKKSNRPAVQRVALKELETLHKRFLDSPEMPNGTEFAVALSGLLRRYALVRYPQDEVAGLTGESWLSFLDRTGGDGGFQNGPGRTLLSAPYRSVSPPDPESLYALARQWIVRNRPHRRGLRRA